MGIYVKMSFVCIFSLFFVFKHDFINVSSLSVSLLQTQQVMTSLIRSHIEYLIQTYHIL